MSRIGLRNSMRIRWYSTSKKYAIMDPMKDLLETEQLKHKNHPGIVKPKQILAPSWLIGTVRNILTDNKLSASSVHESGQKLANYLNGRHLPVEGHLLELKMNEIRSRCQQEFINKDSDVDIITTPKAKRLIKQCIHTWQPTLYDKGTSLSYLAGRSVPDYTVLYRILNDIKTNDSNFTPRTLFDFGSGIGTVLWVASQLWNDSLKEYVCVDISGDMIDLSGEIIKHATPAIKSENIFYRQYLPIDANRSYDIVVSAYSLFELDSLKSRADVLSKLWKRTNQYLVLVEQGTNAGFTAIHEARDFILNYTKFNSDSSSGYVFAPCPSDLKCPRYKENDTPCNFVVNYQTLPISGVSNLKTERYSYVVLKKGKRPDDDSEWPRIVRPTLVRGKHVVCRLCTASGELKEHIFTRYNSGRHTYRCARESSWGDRLPVKLVKEN